MNAVLVAYLAVQLWLPLRVLGRESFYPSGRAGREYSWGMYARSFSYAARYRIVRKGSFTDVRPEDYFPGVGRFHRVLEHQRLARFNAWLCDELRARGLLREGDILIGSVQLAPTHAEPTSFLAPNTDLCTSPIHGVRLP